MAKVMYINKPVRIIMYCEKCNCPHEMNIGNFEFEYGVDRDCLGKEIECLLCGHLNKIEELEY